MKTRGQVTKDEDKGEGGTAGSEDARVYHAPCIFSHCYCIFLIHKWMKISNQHKFVKIDVFKLNVDAKTLFFSIKYAWLISMFENMYVAIR